MRCHNTSKIISSFNFRGLWDSFWTLLSVSTSVTVTCVWPGQHWARNVGLWFSDWRGRGVPRTSGYTVRIHFLPGRGCAPYPVGLQNSYSNCIVERRVLLQSPSWPLHSHTSPREPSILFSNWWPIYPFFLYLLSSQKDIPIFTLGFQCKCWQYGHLL